LKPTTTAFHALGRHSLATCDELGISGAANGTWVDYAVATERLGLTPETDVVIPRNRLMPGVPCWVMLNKSLLVSESLLLHCVFSSPLVRHEVEFENESPRVLG
jgi:hypothetical protein